MRITRRRFLGASAGLAASGLGALATRVPGMDAVSAAELATPLPVPHHRGLVGSTVPRSALDAGCYYEFLTQDQADAMWEKAVGRTMSVTKRYNDPSTFPIDLATNNIGNYIRRGVKCCISFKPAFAPTSSKELGQLDATLAKYRSAGLNAEICLWQEAGNRANGMSPADYQAVYQYYGPTVRKYYPLVANLNYADLTISGFTDYGRLVVDLVDKFAIDYYYNNFDAGHPLDPAQAIADGAGLPFGIWECSTAGPPPVAPDSAHGIEFVQYLLSFMQARLTAGKTNADVIWFDGSCATTDPKSNQPVPILSAGDYRVPPYQALWDDLSAAA